MSTQTNKKLVEQLFGAGGHFGFSKSRRHPTVVPYLYGTKHGNDILDLEQTAAKITEASELLTTAGKDGKVLLVVGTKDEVTRLVKQVSEASEIPAVFNRWIGGTITNFSEIKKRIKRMISFIEDRESGELDKKYTKKERLMISREIDKLEHNYGGIKTLEKNPDLMLVIDPRHDSIAVTEAKEANIPVIAIMSSDCDASKISLPILVNDSLTTSVELVLKELTAAYVEGRKAYTPKTNQSRRPARA